MTEITLAKCGITDADAAILAQALATKDGHITSLNLEGNRIQNDGAIAIAKAVAVNTKLLTLNLLNQAGAAFGQTCLDAWLKAFETNFTCVFRDAPFVRLVFLTLSFPDPWPFPVLFQTHENHLAA